VGTEIPQRSFRPQPASRLPATPRTLHLIKIKDPAAIYRYLCRMSSDAPLPPLCPDCGEPMKLIKTIAHVSGLPELFVFYCSRCKRAETKVQQRDAA
jgi:hypothetical protein